jgi:phage-related holin
VFSIKTFFIKLLASLSLIFAPLLPIAVVLGILIFLDFVTGAYKAYKAGENISSRKMSHTVSKMFLYQIAIIAGFLAETYILMGIPITKIVSGFIALTELKSISENIASVTGINYWKKIQEYLKRPSLEEPKKDI